MIASFRQVQKPPRGRDLLRSGWTPWHTHGTPVALLFLKECSKLISPTQVERMNSLQLHELLTCRGCIAPKLCEEINNSVLIGYLIFRDTHLSNGLHEFVHDGLSVHPPTTSPRVRNSPDSGMMVESYDRTA